MFVGLFVCLYIAHSLLMHPKSMFSVPLFIHIPHKSIYFCYSFFCWTWYSRQGHTIDLYNTIIHLITFLYLCLHIVCFINDVMSPAHTCALIVTDKIPSWVNKAILDFWCSYEYVSPFPFQSSFYQSWKSSLMTHSATVLDFPNILQRNLCCLAKVLSDVTGRSSSMHFFIVY